MDPLFVNTTESLFAAPCAAEVAGFGIGLGLLAATLVASGAALYLGWCRSLPPSSCPYCDKPFKKEVLREHLQGCEEHLKHYAPQGRGGIAQEMRREVFYERSARRLPSP
jgi:hypothetical protein